MDHLLSKIASNAPAPASGSAAAAVVAAAAALVQKVALLSSKQWPGAADAHGRAERLRLHSEELVETDSLSYLAYVEAVRSGQDVEGARARTVEVPLEIVRAAAEVAALAEQSASLGNPRLRADAVVAGMLASAAAEAAAFLVAVNLGEVADERLEVARRLAGEASARLASPGARGSSDDPGHGRARPADSRRP
ncbi:MAG TPA: cyclodeaminase/cyclohydrolase family protein [Candidatus Dormibacteraeota bacterium]|nr:cyclodeaminase/cyclohydrolase family protein [Candidatus Dormibacteraeota bacterium]